MLNNQGFRRSQIGRVRRAVSLLGVAVAGVLLAMTLAAPASAALIIDGEGGTPAPGGRPLLNRNEHDFYFQALRFTLPFEATITSIQAMIGGYQAGAYDLAVADAANLNTDNNLLSLSLYADLDTQTGVDTGRYMGPTNLSLHLLAGDYWLKFTVPEGGLDGFLRAGGSYPYLAGFAYENSGGYQNFGQDNVAVAIYGFAGTGGGVPEPATWGLLIMGFATIGLAVRRRRFGEAAA